MYCTSCGSRNADESNFCKQCGQRLEKPVSVKITEEDFEKALPDDEHAGALVERAYRLRKDGKLAEAVLACEEAIRLREDSTTAHSLLGQLYEGLGDHEGAIREFERVLSLNPGSIADRVMLDDLKTGGSIAESKIVGKPRILLVDRKENTYATQSVLNTIGIAAVTLLIGIGGALLWKSESRASNRDQNEVGSTVQHPGSANAVGNSGTTTSAIVPSGTYVDPAGQKQTSSMGQSAASPYSSLPMQGVYTGYPPYYPQGYSNPQTGNQIVYVPVPGTARQAQNSAPVRQQSGNRETANNAGNDGDHVLLNSDDSGSPIVINVKDKHAHPEADNGDQATAPKLPDSIVIHNNGAGGDQSAPDGPGSDALKWIAIASEKNQQKDYSGAVTALRKAIPSAGSKLAYVYLEMARGYEHLQDKNNALSCYTSSLNEWEKLLNANQQVETARASIKVCQNGIKLCTAE